MKINDLLRGGKKQLPFIFQLSLEVKEAVHDLSCPHLLISDFGEPSFSGDAPLPVSSSLSPPPPDYDAPEPPCC